MPSELHRGYEEGDEKEIVLLLDEVFSGWPKFDLTESQLDHWRWKYHRNVLNKPLVAISEVDDKIIGFDHTQINRIKILDEIHLCSLGGDACVHKDYRGKGYHSIQSEKSREFRIEAGITFGHSITANEIIIGMMERSPTRKLFPVQLIHYVRIRDFDLHLRHNPKENKWINKIGFYALNRINTIVNKQPRLSASPSFVIEIVDKFDSRMDDFWNLVKDYYDLIFVHDKEYMNWRYLDPRAGPFIVKQAVENGKIVGFIVCRINKLNPNYSIGFIADILVSPSREDVAEALLADSVKMFDQCDVNIINFLAVRGYMFDNILRKLGFLDSRRNHYIYYNKLSDMDYMQLVKKSPPEKIHFYFAELDVI